MERELSQRLGVRQSHAPQKPRPSLNSEPVHPKLAKSMQLLFGDCRLCVEGGTTCYGFHYKKRFCFLKLFHESLSRDNV